MVTICVQTTWTAASTALPSSLTKRGSQIDIGTASVTGTITVTLPVPAGQTPADMRIFHWIAGAGWRRPTGA